MVEHSLDLQHIDGAETTFALAAVEHEIRAGLRERLEDRGVGCYCGLEAEPRDPDKEVLGFEPSAVAEGFIAELVDRESGLAPLSAHRVHEADGPTHVQLGAFRIAALG